MSLSPELFRVENNKGICWLIDHGYVDKLDKCIDLAVKSKHIEFLKYITPLKPKANSRSIKVVADG